MTVMDELIEWNHKYQTYMRRYIEVTPARRDLCFAPTADHWKLLLRQEESLHRQIERKTRLLWAMQEEDRQRKQDPQWQEIVAQAAETRQIQARDQDAELAKNMDDAVMEIVKKFNEIQEQSRQAAEKKGRLRENRGRGPGVRGRKTGVKGRGSVVRRERNSRVSRWEYRRGPLGARCGGGPAGRTAEKP